MEMIRKLFSFNLELSKSFKSFLKALKALVEQTFTQSFQNFNLKLSFWKLFALKLFESFKKAFF